MCVSRMHPRSCEVSLPHLFEQTPRVAMLADRVVLGFNRVTARCELVIFLPALSDLKFADIPNGVQALYKMPAEAASSAVPRWSRDLPVISSPSMALFLVPEEN